MTLNAALRLPFMNGSSELYPSCEWYRVAASRLSTMTGTSVTEEMVEQFEQLVDELGGDKISAADAFVQCGEWTVDA